MPVGDAERSRRVVGEAQQELIESGHARAFEMVWVIRGVVIIVVVAAIVERQGSSGTIAPRLGIRILKLATDLDGVVALNSREVFLPIVRGVRTSDDGIALNSADN